MQARSAVPRDIPSVVEEFIGRIVVAEIDPEENAILYKYISNYCADWAMIL